ncbi:hypothetical protein KP509_30G040000 [Ceratopteris richardii]|uniref:Amine oxidase domain-containing protein n=1 Tax=Ceratopteris richardii TaxID=49495 RepID=A0A8T2R3V2_CERRI|nr:hypothetical protein KP509_30G040000 [Ceratopteris richardii]
MQVLRKLFGKDIPEPENILVPRWWRNRLYGGSYTNWPIGVSEADFDRMKAPVGPLYFTGEHTSSKFNGYVHGAYLAGIATAETLLDCIKYKKCKEITSNDLPWMNPSTTQVTNKTEQTCSGVCCKAVQQITSWSQRHHFSMDRLLSLQYSLEAPSLTLTQIETSRLIRQDLVQLDIRTLIEPSQELVRRWHSTKGIFSCSQ